MSAQRMKLIYIAGPYRAACEYSIRENIRTAERAAADVWRMGHAALCPHKNTGGLGGVVPEQAFIDGDLVMLERCDAVIMVGLWTTSAGACGEKERAEQMGIPVFTEMAALDRWLTGTTGRKGD